MTELPFVWLLLCEIRWLRRMDELRMRVSGHPSAASLAGERSLR